jgi:hypothetical protein
MNFEDLKDYLIPAITAVVVWFSKGKILHTLNLKREEKNQETISLENLQKKVDIYQEMLTDLPNRYKQQITDLEQSFKNSMIRLEEEIGHLRVINQELKEIVQEQKAFIAKQSSSLAYYERKYGTIVKN